MRPLNTISIRQMEMIWAILTTGTMAKAAQELNVSQPAISRMVKHAEDRSGLQLFERRGTRLVPTPSLQALATEFERVFVNVDRVQRLAIALRQGWDRPIRLGSMAMLAGTFATKAIAELRAKERHTPIVIKLADRPGVEREILSDDCDLGLVHGLSVPGAIRALPLCEGTVVCLLPESHALARKSVLAPSDLAEEDLISMGRLSPLSTEVQAAFEAAGHVRRIAVQTADSRLAAQFTAEGIGIALLDTFFLGSTSLDGLVVRPFRPRIVTTCFAIHRRDRELSEPEQTLLASLRSVADVWQRKFAPTLDI